MTKAQDGTVQNIFQAIRNHDDRAGVLIAHLQSFVQSGTNINKDSVAEITASLNILKDNRQSVQDAIVAFERDQTKIKWFEHDLNVGIRSIDKAINYFQSNGSPGKADLEKIISALETADASTGGALTHYRFEYAEAYSGFDSEQGARRANSAMAISFLSNADAEKAASGLGNDAVLANFDAQRQRAATPQASRAGGTFWKKRRTDAAIILTAAFAAGVFRVAAPEDMQNAVDSKLEQAESALKYFSSQAHDIYENLTAG